MRCGKASRSPTGPTLSVMIAVVLDGWGRWDGHIVAEGAVGGDARGYRNVETCVDAEVDTEDCASVGDSVVA
jgi:hypothetical protein